MADSAGLTRRLAGYETDTARSGGGSVERIPDLNRFNFGNCPSKIFVYFRKIKRSSLS